MNDYKELIENLKRHSCNYALENRCYMCGVEQKSLCRTMQLLFAEAADAIEQLVNERDAAEKAISHNCFTCKRFPIFHKEGFSNAICKSCYINRYNKWEWRGVQE